jgi:hypothetical protein
MYGYLRPVKVEGQEWGLYRASYCALCKAIHREYGFVYRAGLSYEIAFLLLFITALARKEPVLYHETCVLHPFRKRTIITSVSTAPVCAAINQAFLLGKIEDDLYDKESFRYLRKRIASHLSKQQKKLFRVFYTSVQSGFSKIRQRETAKEQNIDEVASLFGGLLEEIVSIVCTEEGIQPSPPIKKMSDLLGRWVYCIDAIDDLQKDYTKKRYNPLIFKYKEQFLTADSINSAVESVIVQEGVRIRLLSEHIGEYYTLFRRQLGLYSVEIDDIIFRSIPAVSVRVLNRSRQKEKK